MTNRNTYHTCLPSFAHKVMHVFVMIKIAENTHNTLQLLNSIFLWARVERGDYDECALGSLRVSVMTQHLLISLTCLVYSI